MSEPADILKRPYVRTLQPEEDGSWFGAIIEFPGCFAVGDSPAEAATSLEEVAIAWLEAAQSQGQAIPEPIEGPAAEPTALRILQTAVGAA